jgi:hypothetical protein
LSDISHDDVRIGTLLEDPQNLLGASSVRIRAGCAIFVHLEAGRKERKRQERGGKRARGVVEVQRVMGFGEEVITRLEGMGVSGEFRVHKRVPQTFNWLLFGQVVAPNNGPG